MRDPWVIACALAGALLAGWCGERWFDSGAFDQDSTAYVFQARLFASGRLALPAPPTLGLSSSCHVNVHRGRWYGKYPPGNPLVLAVGEVVGAPWLIPPLLNGLGIWLLAGLVAVWHDRRTARVVAALAVVSPAALVLGSSVFSENASRVWLALFLLGAWRGEGRRDAVLAGVGLGMAAVTRPLTAVAFGLAWLVVVRRDARKVAWGLLPLGLIGAAQLAYNAAQTGHPLQHTHNAVQRHDRLGYGQVGTGLSLPPELPAFTPGVALDRIWRHVIPCIAHNALGWGSYRAVETEARGACTEHASVGLIARDPVSRRFVVAEWWGHGDGAAHAQLKERGRVLGEVGPIRPATPGLADVALRLRRDGDRWTASVRMGDGWRDCGAPVALPRFDGPLEVGLFCGVPGLDGRLVVDVRRLEAIGGLRAGLDDPAWRWGEHAPRSRERTAEGWRIEAAGDQALADDRVCVRVQDTVSRGFELVARLRVDWRHEEPPAPGPRTWLLVLVPLLAALPWVRGARPGDWQALALLPASLLLYGMYHYESSAWGATPLSSRYYNEAIVLGLLPLMGRGMLVLWDAFPRRAARVSLVLALGVLTLDTGRAYRGVDWAMPRWSEVYQHLPQRVESLRLEGAVVYLLGTPQAPLGEYPFVPLERASVVYYKLGPARRWGLEGEDWREVHARRFPDRRPFLFHDGKLTELR